MIELAKTLKDLLQLQLKCSKHKERLEDKRKMKIKLLAMETIMSKKENLLDVINIFA
jgi:hypothetical protein